MWLNVSWLNCNSFPFTVDAICNFALSWWKTTPRRFANFNRSSAIATFNLLSWLQYLAELVLSLWERSWWYFLRSDSNSKFRFCVKKIKLTMNNNFIVRDKLQNREIVFTSAIDSTIIRTSYYAYSIFRIIILFITVGWIEIRKLGKQKLIRNDSVWNWHGIFHDNNNHNSVILSFQCNTINTPIMANNNSTI